MNILIPGVIPQISAIDPRDYMISLCDMNYEESKLLSCTLFHPNWYTAM